MSHFPPWCRYVIGLMSVCLTLSAGSAAALETVTLQLKWTHAFQFAGYYAAKEQGYYREAGLEVDIREASPTTDPVRSVLDGRAQFGVGTSSLILERKAGKPVVVLAVVFQQSPYEIHAAPGINHLEDLIGKRLMLEPQADELLAFLKKAGVPLERIQIMPHSFDADGLMHGKADAISGYISNEPYYFKLARYPYQTFSPRSVGIDFYGDNLFTSEQELREHPARVKAFRAATMRGWKYAKEHRDEVIELIRARYSRKHTFDFLRYESDQMIPLLQPNLIEIGYMNPARWRHIADTYADIGLLPVNYPLDGFIYNADTPDLSWFYRSLTGALLLIVAISGIAVYIFRQNRRQSRMMEQNRLDGEALARLNEELQRKNAEIEQLIYAVSHDLRSPLVTVKTFLGYLAEDIPRGDSDRIGTDMGFILTAADRMEALLNELLDMARVGRAIGIHEEVTFQELVCEARDALAGQINESRTVIQVSSDNPVLCGDRRRLLQIWQNLLENALKYMGDQASPRIQIGVEQQHGETVFFVRDNGIGIAPAHHEKVFGIFEQIDRQSGGVGMGLAMVRRIVEVYGGNIRVESKGEGMGSTFHFTLPGAMTTGTS